MDRVLEPELMNDPEQVLAYSNADFAQAHQTIVDNFAQIFPEIERRNAQTSTAFNYKK